MARQQNKKKDANVKRVNPSQAKLRERGTSRTNLRASSENTDIQNEIARTIRRSGNSAGFSGRGINETIRPDVIYNLERGLTKQQLRDRVETMMGRRLTRNEYRHLSARRVKSLDEKAKQSSTDRFGKEIRSFRTMEAWRITYS